MENIIIIIFLGLMGSVMGSFIGAMVWRMKNDMDFVKGRSECEHCHHRLSILDLVPIVSWISLRGKCRYCHKPIGWLTLLLEISLAAAFVLSFVFWPLGEIYSDGLQANQLVAFVVWLVCVVVMAALAVYDLKWRTLPNKLVFLLIALALVLNITNNFFIHDNNLLNWLLQTFYSMLPIVGVYGIIYLFSRGSMIGFGDVKLGIAIGLLLGWKGALVVLVLANILGSLVVLPQLLRKKMNMDSQIPFGPFLIIASYGVFLFYEQAINFMTKNLLIL